MTPQLTIINNCFEKTTHKICNVNQLCRAGISRHCSIDRANDGIFPNCQKAGLKIAELLWLGSRFDGLMVFITPDAETASAAMLLAGPTGNVKTETRAADDANAMKQVIDKL